MPQAATKDFHSDGVDLQVQDVQQDQDPPQNLSAGNDPNQQDVPNAQVPAPVLDPNLSGGALIALPAHDQNQNQEPSVTIPARKDSDQPVDELPTQPKPQAAKPPQLDDDEEQKQKDLKAKADRAEQTKRLRDAAQKTKDKHAKTEEIKLRWSTESKEGEARKAAGFWKDVEGGTTWSKIQQLLFAGKIYKKDDNFQLEHHKPQSKHIKQYYKNCHITGAMSVLTGSRMGRKSIQEMFEPYKVDGKVVPNKCKVIFHEFTFRRREIICDIGYIDLLAITADGIETIECARAPTTLHCGPTLSLKHSRSILRRDLMLG